MDDAIYVVLLILCGCNCLLHGLATLILLKLNKRHKNSSQWYCLINLTVSELLQNLFRFVLYPLKLYWNIHPKQSMLLGRFIVHIQLVLNTGMIYQCLLGMILITGDRFLCIFLDLKYRIYWSYQRTRILVLSTWVFCFIVTILLSVHMDSIIDKKLYEDAEQLDSIQHYILTIISTLFVSFASFSYGYIFYKYLQSQRNMLINNAKSLSVWQMFRTSKFFISVLLVSSFFVFWVVPTLIVNIYGLMSEENKSLTNYALTNYVNVSYIISDLVDGIIYVFLRPSVQKELMNQFSNARIAVSRYGHSKSRHTSYSVDAESEL